MLRNLKKGDRPIKPIALRPRLAAGNHQYPSGPMVVRSHSASDKSTKRDRNKLQPPN
ncbi:MAG: hypothetical protein ICV52_03535, partial [Microcoleus sp. C1-bin4]|nr:hypothetical protein [Microcoleus sp. C1-bin4]